MTDLTFWSPNQNKYSFMPHWMSCIVRLTLGYRKHTVHKATLITLTFHYYVLTLLKGSQHSTAIQNHELVVPSLGLLSVLCMLDLTKQGCHSLGKRFFSMSGSSGFIVKENGKIVKSRQFFQIFYKMVMEVPRQQPVLNTKKRIKKQKNKHQP